MVVIFSCKEKIKPFETEKQPTIINYLNEPKEAFNERMEWWRDARFGMFIHWGAYAIPAGIHKEKQVEGIGEWIQYNGKIPVNEYETYAKQFNPVKFDADLWAKTMKEAGMKYVVITSKHHDGFGLWNSKISNYNIVEFSPYGKDILKALSESCKAQGIKFGLYYSILDWHHPKAQYNEFLRAKEDKTDYSEQFKDYLENYMKPQIKELIDNYDPEILWFDGEWVSEFTHKQGLELYQYVRSLKPDILINNRVDKGRAGMQGMNKEGDKYAGDFGTPEQEILENASTLDWESCMTVNDTWGYKSLDHNWKSAQVLVHNLIDVTAKGGNYLLNVGPTAEGIIPKPSVERLAKIGKWLAINGEAIYKTEKLNEYYMQGENIRYTKQKGKNIFYAISLQSPKNEITFKYVIPEKNSKIYMIGYDQSLDWKYTNDGLKINIPKLAYKTLGNTEAWVFKINGKEANNSKQ